MPNSQIFWMADHLENSAVRALFSNRHLRDCVRFPNGRKTPANRSRRSSTT